MMSGIGISFMDGFSCLNVLKADRDKAFSALVFRVAARLVQSAPDWFVADIVGERTADAETVADSLRKPGKTVTLKSGVLSARDFVLNAARGDDAQMLVSRIEGAADHGTFVRCRDRSWFAGIVRSAMSSGLMDVNSSWRNLPILVETASEGDLLIGSPASGLAFPSDDRDVQDLVAAGQMGISPENWKTFVIPASS